MPDIAFIGDRNTVWPFKAFGAQVYFLEEEESLPGTIREVIQKQFSIVFVTEEVYEMERERIDKLAELSTPAFTIIPSIRGNRMVAAQKIRDSVRRAMGAEFI